MDSFTITLSGTEPELKSVFFPPLELNGDYLIGLVDFQSYNSIFNVKKPFNNFFYYEIEKFVMPKGKNINLDQINAALDGVKFILQDNQIIVHTKIKLLYGKGLLPKLLKLNKNIIDDVNDDIYFYNIKKQKIIEIAEGSYEISEIAKEVQKQLPDFILQANNVKMKATLISHNAVFDFTKAGIGTNLLGFYGVTTPGVPFVSSRKVNINNINVIRVQCNIANGSFLNGKRSHTIHSFYPRAPPGYKIIEVPKNILYFPVNKRILDTVICSFADQHDNPIDFNGEETTITCHIKKNI